ncbi:MAG: extracellular solute-binding protein [Micrococcales bacterium]|nr:extracellular solute-binding protein [Micrococcales bacterium]
MKLSRQSTRKIIASAAATALALAAMASLAACGSKDGDSNQGGSGTTEINALFMKQAGYSEEQIGSMIDQFEEAHSNIKVNATFVSYEALHDKIVTSAPAGTFDVVLIDVIWPAEFATSGIVLDVTERYPANWESDMLGGAFTTAKFDDKFWGVPWGPSTKYFYYNKTMVEAVGASESDLDTWGGVLATAQKIKEAGLAEYPLAWSWAQAEAAVCDYGQMLGAFGGQFTDASGALAVNQGAGVQALEWMRQTVVDGLSNPASITFLEDDVQKTLAQGETAFALNWESTFEDLQDPDQSRVAGQIGLLPTPMGPAGDRPGINGAMALSIGAKSKHVEEAWTFIEFVTSQAIQNQFPTGWMPNWKSSYDDAAITGQAPELFAAAPTALATLILRPTVPNYNSASAALQVELQQALSGAKEPQQAMDDAVAAAQ